MIEPNLYVLYVARYILIVIIASCLDICYVLTVHNILNNFDIYNGVASLSLSKEKLKISVQTSRVTDVARHCHLIPLTYLLTYFLTYLLTPWSTVLLEKLTGLQLVK